jgi:pimeloyl-ACP methyl ester carboxylesterase
MTTLDGLSISGTWQPAPGARRGPGLLLVHDFEGDRHEWDPAWAQLQAAGISLLAIDLRSHGESDAAAIPAVQLQSDPDEFPQDVRAGLTWLQEQIQVVDPALIGVAGLGVGANLAIVANLRTDGTPSDWGAGRALAISARRDRAEDLALDSTLTLHGMSFAAGALEEPQATDAAELRDLTEGDRGLLLVPETADHGAVLLANHQEVRDAVAGWFTATAW